MKQRRSLFFTIAYRLFMLSLFFCLSLFLVACSKEKTGLEPNQYDVFCLDATETKITSESYAPKAKKPDKLIPELISRMQKEPKDISFKKAIPDKVTLDSYILSSEGNLTLFWNSAYGNLTGITEILRRAAIVKTLSQIPEISSIQFYVSGQPLTDSNLNAIGFMTADTFIDNTGDTAYTQTTTLIIYFANSQGTGLIEVPEEITYDASIPLEQLAMQELIDGPVSSVAKDNVEIRKTIPDGTRINKISVKENTCYLDLSSEFLEKRSDISDDVAIYSVVNTLVELPNINKVQFSIDGEQVLLYDDKINFGEPFESNLNLITDK